MLVQPGTKLLGELISDFCFEKGLGNPPAKVNLYSREEYIKETGDDKTPARYSATEDKIAVSPDIVSHIKLILHELAHHYQTLRDGATEFNRKYDEYTKAYGYVNNPYEVESREFEMKWWSEFERLLRKKLGD